MSAVSAFAPATMGNVAAGFDCLGMAIRPVAGTPWGDTVTAREDGPALTVEGPFSHRLPPDPADNLVTQCADLYADTLRAHGRTPRPVSLTLHKGLPICSGLGSSAASVVATLAAVDAWNGGPLAARLLSLAGRGEALVSGDAHYDNVGPALLGGLVLCTADAGCQPLPFPDAWRIAVVHADISVPTAEARVLLPKQVPLPVASTYWQNLATLVHALHANELDLAATCFHDTIVEPARAPLVPGFEEAKAGALAAGAAGCSLSGSGPAIFAIVTEPDCADAVLEALTAPFADRAVRGAVCRADRAGVVVEEVQ